MYSRNVVVLLLAALGGAQAQQPNCPSGSGCTFEPFNPVACGPPDYLCGYTSPCLARSAGWTTSSQCCQAPQPSGCPAIYAPVVCGSMQCPYASQCIATLAGYSSGQCSPAPVQCANPDPALCSGQPANPVKCGTTPDRTCLYQNYCLAEKAGFNIQNDCCQDTKGLGTCSSIFAPVSCGPPGGKACVYSTQCEANGAGYNPNQCCAAVPEGTACTSISEPVTCGRVPCQYPNQCSASAAGFTASQCCRTVETGSCTNEYIPHTCGQAGCVYGNACLAQLAGFDPNSCVKAGPATTAESGAAGVTGKTAVLSMTAAAVLFPLL